METLFYRNRRLLILTLLLIIVAGVSAFTSLPRLEDPRFTNRDATIVTLWPAADAERVEALVTKELEDQLQEIEEIDKLVSSSRAGVSVVYVTLSDLIEPHESQEVWSRIRDEVDDAAVRFPPDALEPEFNNDETFAYTLLVALTWDHEDSAPNRALLGRLAEELEDRLRAVSGTEHTTLFARETEEIRVEISPDRLTAIGLTVDDLAARLAGTDAKVAAGRLETKDVDWNVEVSGEFEQLRQVRETPVRTGARGSMITLGDLGSVEKTVDESPDELAWIGGRTGVLVGARMEPGIRIDDWAENAALVVDDFEAELSQGIGLVRVFEQDRYTSARLKALITNFSLGVLSVIIVVFLLMGWRSAILTGIVLPLCACLVLAGMKLLGVPMHQMSITGLIVALGILIDNVIVMLDEVKHRLDARESGDERSTEGAITMAVRHLALPLLASTITTVLAFLPILMPGAAGEFVGTIGLSVILSVTTSLALTLTIVPPLSAFLTKIGQRRPSLAQDGIRSHRLEGMYRRVLSTAFHHPWLAIAFALLLPLLGFYASTKLSDQFFPSSDRDMFQVQLRLPQQVTIEETLLAAKEARALLAEHPSIVESHWFMGGGTPAFYYNLISGEDNAPYFAHGLVQLKSSEGSAEVVQEVQRTLDHALPNVQSTALMLAQGPPTQAPIELEITGPDLNVLRDLGEQARSLLKEIPGITQTRTSLIYGRPKIHVDLEDTASRMAGIDNVTVARSLESALSGAVSGSMLEGTERLPVRVRMGGVTRTSLGGIAGHDIAFLDSTDGADSLGNVPLSAVSELSLIPEISSIARKNGVRVNTIRGQVEANALPSDVQNRFLQALEEHGVEAPPGYRMRFAGESGERARAIRNLLGSAALLVIVMITTLVLVLRSFALTGLIAVVGVAGAGLSLGSLYLFGLPFGFMAILGTLGLIGIAINDSIVVLAALRESEGARQGDPDATREVIFRATRHVLTTTFTTAAGFSPLIIFGGGFWPPLAIAISTGVIGATLLALTMVPAAFLIIHRRRYTPDPSTSEVKHVAPAPQAFTA